MIRDRQSGGVISGVEPDSIADDLDWRPGDEIISINGHSLHDVIDFRFYSAEDHIVVTLRRGFETAEFEIEKDPDEPLGVEFADVLFDGVRLCGAHCVFCFVEQLPKGLRKSLYLKDDDYRLSFLHGNYVTLANATHQDLERIIVQRLSPLYVSVHATEPDLRERMLGRGAPDILDQMDFLAQGRISLHTQIVLCRGINDGEHLDRSVADLAARYPTVQSIAIVPVGLTAHRRNKTPIGAIDADYSRSILRKVRDWQRKFLREMGTRLVWAADEFYLNADHPVPSAAAYEGFPQIENGVGLVRQFRDSAYRAARLLRSGLPRSLAVSVVTGVLAKTLLEEWARSVESDKLTINVHGVENRLFGQSVTVAGLLSGKDIIGQLQDKELGDVVFIPSVAVRDGAFLDDVTVDEIESALRRRVIVVEPRPYQLARRILEESRRLSGERVE
jgi:putative radical SAM enzyme (TIGR03279 family)